MWGSGLVASRSLFLGGDWKEWILRGEGDGEGRGGYGGEGEEEGRDGMGKKETQEVKVYNIIRPSALVMKHRKKKERRKGGIKTNVCSASIFIYQLFIIFENLEVRKINEFPNIKPSPYLMKLTHSHIVTSQKW